MDRAAFVFADEDDSPQWQRGIFWQSDGVEAYCSSCHPLRPNAQCVKPKIGMTGQFPRAVAGPFGEAALMVRLQLLCDAFDLPCLFAESGFVIENVGNLCSQIFNRHALQAATSCVTFNAMVSDLFCWRLGTLNRADHGARFAGERQGLWRSVLRSSTSSHRRDRAHVEWRPQRLRPVQTAGRIPFPGRFILKPSFAGGQLFHGRGRKAKGQSLC